MADGGFDYVVDVLRSRGLESRHRDRWHCPAHDDQDPSLLVYESGDGDCKLVCKGAGCSSKQIMEALGLEHAQLFKNYVPKGDKSRRPKDPFILPEGMAWRKVSQDWCHDAEGNKVHWEKKQEPHRPCQARKGCKGCKDCDKGWVNCRLEAEALGYKGKRISQGRSLPNGDPGYSFEEGWYIPTDYRGWSFLSKAKRDKDIKPEHEKAIWLPKQELFIGNLPAVRKAIEAGRRVFLCAGPKDAKVFRKWKEVATWNPAGEGKWDARFTEQLSPLPETGYELWIVRDRDAAGIKAAREKGLRLEANGFTVRVCEAKVGKDPFEHAEAKLGVSDLVEIEDWRDDLGVALEVVEGGAAAPSPGPHPQSVPPERGNASKGGAGDEPERDFHWTDLGMAERLVWLNKGDLRYVPKLLSWAVWTGLHWKIDENNGEPIQARIKEMLRNMQEKAKAQEPFDVGVSAGEERDPVKVGRELIGKQVKSLRAFESANKINAIDSTARKEPGIPVAPEEFDQLEDILVVQNGVLDLKTGGLRAPERSDMCTKVLNLEYDADAQCPRWMEFLDFVFDGDAEMKRFIWKLFGYTATGSVKEQVFAFFHGPGGGGKSLICDVMGWVLGPYAGMLMPKKLMERKFEDEIPTDFAMLRGNRFVKVPEVDNGMRLDESRVKMLTGEEETKARFMRENYFDFRITFKFWMYGNSKPQITGTDIGIRRRPLLIEMPNSVEGTDKKDLDLKLKLKAELPGILAWIAAGAQRWYSEGLQPPDKVRAATAEYFATMDQVQRFIEECCVIGNEYSYRTSELYKHYAKWSKTSGGRTLSDMKFYADMQDSKKYEKHRNSSGQHYIGIAIKPELEEQGAFE